MLYLFYTGFLGGTSGKESTCRRLKRRGFDPWVGKIPWRKKWHPTPVFLAAESHGQRSFAGYRPWGHKELDTCEHHLFYTGFLGGTSGKESTCRRLKRRGLIPGWGRSPGGGNGTPLQYSWQQNPMDRGALRATVHGVTKDSDTSEVT